MTLTRIFLLLLILLAAALAGQPAVSPAAAGGFQTYLPLLPSPIAPEPLPPPEEFTVEPGTDFEEIRRQLDEDGFDLGLTRIGFHTGLGGNVEGLYDAFDALDAAGVPIFIKSADNAEPVYNAQVLRQNSGVPHTMVFRLSTAGQNDGYDYDTPPYLLPPAQAAAIHWQAHMEKFPPELDPSLVWIETTNEPDKNRAEWMAEFALETAQLALADGFNYAAFGWSSGEPEEEHWQGPKMQQFLRFAAAHPDRIAIALHEYSFDATNIGFAYPHLIGRFQLFYQICDELFIDRPTVMITEWGWHATLVPEPDEAMEDLRWAAWLLSAYPQVKGAAIWYLGGGFGGIADDVQLFIAPLTEYALTTYFKVHRGLGLIDPWLFPPPPPEPGFRGLEDGSRRVGERRAPP